MQRPIIPLCVIFPATISIRCVIFHILLLLWQRDPGLLAEVLLLQVVRVDVGEEHVVVGLLDASEEDVV